MSGKGHQGRPGRAELAATLRSAFGAADGQAKVEELLRVIRVPEAARLLGVAESTLRNPPYRYELPTVTIGKRHVGYVLADVLAWNQAHRNSIAD